MYMWLYECIRMSNTTLCAGPEEGERKGSHRSAATTSACDPTLQPACSKAA